MRSEAWPTSRGGACCPDRLLRRVLASVDLVRHSADVEVMNALLLPVVLGFLITLEARALPPRWRMRGTVST